MAECLVETCKSVGEFLLSVGEGNFPAPMCDPCVTNFLDGCPPEAIGYFDESRVIILETAEGKLVFTIEPVA